MLSATGLVRIGLCLTVSPASKTARICFERKENPNLDQIAGAENGRIRQVIPTLVGLCAILQALTGRTLPELVMLVVCR